KAARGRPPPWLVTHLTPAATCGSYLLGDRALFPGEPGADQLFARMGCIALAHTHRLAAPDRHGFNRIPRRKSQPLLLFRPLMQKAVTRLGSPGSCLGPTGNPIPGT